jgi:hypothetical protein
VTAKVIPFGPKRTPLERAAMVLYREMVTAAEDVAAGTAPAFSSEHVVVAEQLVDLADRWDFLPEESRLLFLALAELVVRAYEGP